MKKKAFTLAETLITLGIIGVVAAIVAPLIGSMKPDANKILYLKSYDALADAVKGYVNNASIYAPIYTYQGKSYQVSAYPLLDFAKPANPAFNDSKYSGVNKLGNLLEDTLGGQHKRDIGTSAANFNSGYNFTTNNGVRWWIQPSSNPYSGSGNNLTFYNKITVDVNGDAGPNEYYTNSKPNQTPDRFDFYITSAGNVIPSDVYGQMYVDRRRSFVKRKESVSGYSAITTSTKPLSDEMKVQIPVSETSSAEQYNTSGDSTSGSTPGRDARTNNYDDDTSTEATNNIDSNQSGSGTTSNSSNGDVSIPSGGPGGGDMGSHMSMGITDDDPNKELDYWDWVLPEYDYNC